MGTGYKTVATGAKAKIHADPNTDAGRQVPFEKMEKRLNN
jgi:hypothetical protein